MNEVKALETSYKGYKFRSRLEARWAVFFDTLGIKYEYEPQGYNVGEGLCYLPDFLIHDVCTRYQAGYTKEDIEKNLQDLYVEVKGTPNAEDARKVYLFSQSNPVWVVGDIPEPEDYVRDCERQREEFCEKVRRGEYGFMNHCALCPYDYGTIDNDQCFPFSIGFAGGYLTFHGGDCSYGYGDKYPEIVKALQNARTARFEHGEEPSTTLWR